MKWLDRFLRPSAPDEPGDSAASIEMSSALAAAQAGDYESALTLWEPLARAGNARAQNNIGACFAAPHAPRKIHPMAKVEAGEINGVQGRFRKIHIGKVHMQVFVRRIVPPRIPGVLSRS
jgi:hypothetical protein